MPQKQNHLANCVIGNDGLAMRIQKLANMRNLSQWQRCFRDFVKISACRAIDCGVFESTMIANRAMIDIFDQIGFY